MRSISRLLSAIFVLIVTNTNVGTAAKFSTEEISKALKNDDVVPDVIDTFPNEIINVKYGGNEAALGNKLKLEKIMQIQPVINWNADENKFYLLAMIDPDAPSRRMHILREVLHWMVVNVPGNDIENGKILAEYKGPSPLIGIHRYIFLVYEQSGNITFSQPPLTATSVYARLKFGIRKFALKYKLGEPIAINYFQAKGR